MPAPLRTLIICPGRGSYTARELGTLAGHRAHPQAAALLEQADGLRQAAGRPTVSELDGADRFSPARHLAGEHASALTYTFGALDAVQVDRGRFRPVGVVGNSLGWYTALHVAGVLSFEEGFRIVEATGGWQAEHEVGGQLLYPVVDEEWRLDAARQQEVEEALEQADGQVWPSIELGGYRVLAGDEAGIRSLSQRLPRLELGRNRYPMRLLRHSAFHTPLMAPMAESVGAGLEDLTFKPPMVHMVDGAGTEWRPIHADPQRLRQYTLWHQITRPYDFTQSVRVALRELAPEALLLLGPGGTLGGAIGQCLVQEGWQGIHCKADFKARQASASPMLFTAANRT